MSQRIPGLSAIAANYKAVLCDVWGVLHNGRVVYRDAEQALMTYRKQGGRVVMITNSPRRRQGVISQLMEMGVDPEAFDDIVTSGDVTRTLIQQSGDKIFHLGPERDLPLFEGLGKELVDEDQCSSIVCTGLFEDEIETPQDYHTRLSRLAEKDVPFICANPDLVVERGDRLIYCAGSLAKMYEELGGKTLVAGKPHAPIYNLAMQRLAQVNQGELARSDAIAIGDGMPTDVAGAISNGFDLLYISAGIHASSYGPPDDPDQQALEEFLQANKAEATAWLPRLVWAAN